jgi:hypothetical protein
MESPNSSIDIPKLRGALAERRIAHRQFANVCGLNPRYLSSVLCGKPAGELALLKIERGMKALGLDREAPHAA